MVDFYVNNKDFLIKKNIRVGQEATSWTIEFNLLKENLLFLLRIEFKVFVND